MSKWPPDDCPRSDDHTPCPRGYLAWHRWAEGMQALGYRQMRHDACDLWTQWVTPTGRPARVSIERAIKAGERALDVDRRR